MGLKRLFCTFGSLLGTEGFLQHLMKLLRLPGSCTGLVPGKWLMRTHRKICCSSSWNGSLGTLLVSVSCQLITLWFSSSGYTSPYAGCSRTAMEVIKLSKRAEGILTLFLVLSHHTQLFSADALWSLGSVFNVRYLLSEYQCCYLIVLFVVFRYQLALECEDIALCMQLQACMIQGNVSWVMHNAFTKALKKKQL